MSSEPLRLKQPYIDSEKRANLGYFVDRLDRTPPPIFVGREDVISQVKRMVSNCRVNSEPADCFTLVIQGVPGAGKTSLLTEIEKRLGREKEGQTKVDDSLVVVNFSGEMFSNELLIAHGIIEAYTGEHLDDHAINAPYLSARGKLPVFEATRQTETTARNLEDQIRSAGGLWQPVVNITSINEADTVCLLLIDEAQNIPSSHSMTEKNNIVMNLHGGSRSTRGLKIVPVFAGLSDTESVLASRGISRIDDGACIHLGALTQGEAEELVSRWIRYEPFGLDDKFAESDIFRLSKMIAVASEGWPRHTNTYLKELGRAILDLSEGELTVDLDKVFDRGNDRRMAYYGNRIATGGLGLYEKVIRDAAQKTSDGIVELDSLLEIAIQNYQFTLPDVQRLNDRAVHAGVLEPISYLDRSRFKFPVPSFFTYVKNDSDTDRFKAIMRKQMESNANQWTETKSEQGSEGLTR